MENKDDIDARANISDPQNSETPTLSRSGSSNVIQPSESFKQEMQAQAIQQEPETPNIVPVAAQPIIGTVSSGFGESVEGGGHPAIGQADKTSFSQPSANTNLKQSDESVNLWARESYNEPRISKPKKKLIVSALAGAVLVAGVITVLLMFNVIAVSEFEKVSYTNDKGAEYSFDFYAKHGSKELYTGNNQLVSKVSKDGKFPIALSISTIQGTEDFGRLKNCSGFQKVFDAQNDNLNQIISVCYLVGNNAVGQQDAKDAIYIAGFTSGNKTHVMTIAQDYGAIDFSNKSAAKESLNRFGLTTYQPDIERIVSSVAVK